MGWLIYSRYNSPRTYAEEKAEILRLHTACEGAEIRYEVLHVANVRPFWVCAVKVIPLTEARAEAMRNDSRYVADADGSYVFASVIKTSRSGGEWGYKDGDEATGFYGPFDKVPASLIEKLSPLRPDGSGEYDGTRRARMWRESILAAKGKPKIKDGMRIRLEYPALFSVGRALSVWCTEFTATSYTRRGKKRRAYIAHDIGGSLVRLPESHASTCEVIG